MKTVLSERRGADDGDTAFVEDGLLRVGDVEVEREQEVGARLVQVDGQSELVVRVLLGGGCVHPLELHGAQIRPDVVGHCEATSARALRAHQFHSCNVIYS
jgi:hypothetical protein